MQNSSSTTAALMQAIWQPPTVNSRISGGQQQSYRTPADLDSTASLEEWLNDDILWQQTQAAKPAKHRPLPKSLTEPLAQALAAQGIDQLYSHQRQSYQAIQTGKDTIITTQTASGKTLAAYLAVIAVAIKSKRRTLALYNLKALSSDQAHSLNELLDHIPKPHRPRFVQLDGDTPPDDRQSRLAEDPHIIGTTPEFIHFQLRQIYWSEPLKQFFKTLRFLIIDEAHTCSGTFGANMQLLIARIRCAVDRAGGNAESLQCIFLSASCGNPTQLARKLSGRKKSSNTLAWVKRSGAAVAEKQYYLIKPHGNTNAEIARLVVYLLKHNRTGIVFCGSIRTVNALYELISKEAHRQHYAIAPDTIATYFAALSADRRRTVIDQIRSGKTRFVITTEALEAGVDLPELDCCILRGSGSTIQSFKQRSGRVGRKRPGQVFYFPLNSTIDRYLVQHPEQIVEAKSESVTFQASPILMGQHLLCAAAESGVTIAQIAAYFGKPAVTVARTLLAQGLLNRRRDGVLWSSAKPHRDLSFRGIANNTVQLIEAQSGEVLQTLSLDAAYRETFEGAIYRAQDPELEKIAAYRSIQLDLNARIAKLERIEETPQFTTAITDDRIVLGETIAPERSQPLGLPTPSSKPALLTARLTWAEIQHRVIGYTLSTKQYERTCLNRSCLKYNQPVALAVCSACNQKTRQAEIVRTIDEVTFRTPAQTSWSTPAFSVQLDAIAQSRLRKLANQLKASVAQTERLPLAYRALNEFDPVFIALHTFGNQLLKALPLSVNLTASDINFQIIQDQSNDTIGVFYNQIPESGGAESLYSRLQRVAEKALELSDACPCETGCVQCLMRNNDPHNNTALVKPIGRGLLQAILTNSGQSNR